jgi:hypothetical protein
MRVTTPADARVSVFMNLQLGPAVGAIGIYDGYLDGELIVYSVHGLPPEECALLAAINTRWKFLRAMNARAEWTGNYGSADEALSALRRHIIHGYIHGIVAREERVMLRLAEETPRQPNRRSRASAAPRNGARRAPRRRR